MSLCDSLVALMSLPLQEHIEKDGFRLRGLSASRIDSFSDAVFAFALTLLVVSLQVPKTYAELHDSLRGFFGFAIVFYLLMQVWWSHYQYFRRFGTHDPWTIKLNAMLLFVVLFYVYPLKFLFGFVTDAMIGLPQKAFDNPGQVRELMLLFGLGFAAIHILTALLYWNGLRQRKTLELNDLEVILTRSYIVGAAGVAAIGVLSCGVALLLPPPDAGYSGWTYLLVFLFLKLHALRSKALIARQTAWEKLTATSH